MTLSVSGTTVVNQNRSFVLGTATPGSPATGMIRYNSSLARFEVYNGSAWVAIISSSPATSPAWAWGFNNNGQLGDYSITSRRSPISVIGGFTDWIEISAGTNTTFAIRANGTLWGWGRNDLGQLGIGNNTSRRSPVSVLGGFTDWVKVSASSNHIAAIRSNGTAWCWGRNDLGQLGTNNTISRNSPVSVVGGFTDWQQINTGGAFHTVAIRTNGTAWGWGYGGRGQLGTNSTTTTSSPVSVVGGFTDWVQISAGRYFTVAIRANGTAWGWGFNSVGALGDGTSTGRSSPVSVVGGFTDWVQISAGTGSNSNTVALRANGTAWGWGANFYGQLGTGNTTYRSSPVSVVGGFTDWVQLSGGDALTVAIRSNGTAWSWGKNDLGQLGDTTVTNKSSPVSVVGGFTDWVQISAGGGHTAALRAV